MTSTIKVNNIQNQCGQNIINENSNTINFGASGDTIALASGASQTGFGRTGTVDWETTPKTTTFTAVAGDGFFANTSSGAFTMNLPAGVAGAIVSVADYAATWQTNALTVSPNGTDKIGGINGDVVLNTEGQSVTFIFVDSTQGWINTMDSTSNVRASAYVTATGGTQTECGDFKIHTFTGPGTFCVSNAGTPGGSETVEYLVVAGGGAGGGCSGGGAGGGAGGFRFASPTIAPLTYPAKPLAGPAALPVSVQGYPIQVGAGAANPGGASAGPGVAGTTNIFNNYKCWWWKCSTTSTSGFPLPGQAGGSGAGSQSSNGGVTQDAGAGNTPPVSPSQGNPGGRHNPYPAGCGSQPYINGGGGGGAMAAGGQNPEAGGIGGGLPTAFGANGEPCGSFRYYAGGGAGICRAGASGQSGGKGGGGSSSGSACGPGPANTGGAAGARGSNTGPLNGGSGIVVIR